MEGNREDPVEMEDVREDALQNPLILECIFQNLSVSDLKTCRQVCRTWLGPSSEAISGSVEVHVSLKQEDEDFKGPSKFLELVNANESTFTPSTFPDSFHLSDGVMDNPEFWTTCGPYIKSLKIWSVTFKCADAFREAIFQSCSNLENLFIQGHGEVLGERAREQTEWTPPKFPPNANLKKLRIDLDREKEFSVGWMEILSHFPSLGNLDVENLENRMINDELFRALAVVRKHDNRCWKLKELAFDLFYMSNPQPTFPVLVEDNLALESLRIRGLTWNRGWEEGSESADAVERILEALSSSPLKRLSLGAIIRAGDGDKVCFPLPIANCIPSLEEIDLYDIQPTWERLVLFAPNLKKISVEVDYLGKSIRSSELLVSSCTELVFCVNQYDVTPEDLGIIRSWLPNLDKLKLAIWTLTNDAFSATCQHWPNLVSLDCFLGDVDDSGISGFEEDYVTWFNGEGERASWTATKLRRPNLSSLKCLRNLTIRTTCSSEFKLGYCAAAHGVSELPQLERLRICDPNGEPVVVLGVWKSLISQFPWTTDEQPIV